MRISVELLDRAASIQNALKERELDLRSNRIPAIENLGITRNQYDTIDLSDNAITRLDNLPFLPRLRSLYLARNPIISISSTLSEAVPNLSSLVLSYCDLNHYAAIEALSQCRSLTHLVMRECPIARDKYYKSAVLYRLPWLETLDFEKLKDAEKVAAKRLFEEQQPGLWTRLKQQQQLATSSQTSTVTGNALSADDVRRIQAAIRQATTLEQVSRLERVLRSGVLPQDIVI